MMENRILGRKVGILYKLDKMEEQMNEKTIRLEFDEADYVWSNYQPVGLKSFRIIKNGEKFNVELSESISIQFLRSKCEAISTRGWLKKYRCPESFVMSAIKNGSLERWGAETFYLRE